MLVGVGDDGAVLAVPPGADLVVAVATWVGGEPVGRALPVEAIAHRLLASALAELVAAGAEPAWFTLALTLPEPDPHWLQAFQAGLDALARAAGVQLVGGDTTSGPASATVHAHGHAPRGGAVPPDGARPGDLVYVTGTLGDAGLALLARRDEVRLPAAARATVERRLLQPTPRLAHGPALRGLASAATGLADGLAAGLSRLVAARGAGATVYTAQLPLSAEARAHLDLAGGWVVPLTAPEAGEICFAVPAERQGEVEARLASLPGGCTWVGSVDRARGVRGVLATGEALAL